MKFKIRSTLVSKRDKKILDNRTYTVINYFIGGNGDYVYLMSNSLTDYVGPYNAEAVESCLEPVKIRNTKLARKMNPKMIEKEGWLYNE